ncbi:hypothetical protein KRMM14A1259_04220 [Krasilnikovia sp. MM14-A1259]
MALLSAAAAPAQVAAGRRLSPGAGEALVFVSAGMRDRIDLSVYCRSFQTPAGPLLRESRFPDRCRDVRPTGP